MAVFLDTPEEIGRRDYRLMQNGAVVLYRKEAVLAEDLDELRRLGYAVDELDASGWLHEQEMHSDIAARLGFPDYYGANLDALRDCLFDLSIGIDGGRVVVVRNFDAFAARLAKVAWIVADILEEVSRSHLLFGRRLIALLQVADGAFTLEPVGARVVMWNPKEWLLSSRTS